MTLGQGQWPRVTGRTGRNQCALLLEKSVHGPRSLRAWMISEWLAVIKALTHTIRETCSCANEVITVITEHSFHALAFSHPLIHLVALCSIMSCISTLLLTMEESYNIFVSVHMSQSQEGMASVSTSVHLSVDFQLKSKMFWDAHTCTASLYIMDWYWVLKLL